MIADYFTSSPPEAWRVVLAVLAVIAGWIISGLAKRATLSLIQRVLPSLKPGVTMLVSRIVRYAVLLLTLGIVLTILGAPLQPVLAAALLIAVVAFLALRGLAENLGAGLVIQARHVVRVGDEIEILGYQGIVTELNGRSVVIHSPDGRSVRLPNSTILTNPLTSLSERGIHRSEIEVRVDASRPYGDVRDLILQSLADEPHVRAVPTVQVLIARHNPTSTTFRVRFWHEPHHRAEARSAASRSVIDVLERDGVRVAVDWKIPDPPLTPPAGL